MTPKVWATTAEEVTQLIASTFFSPVTEGDAMVGGVKFECQGDGILMWLTLRGLDYEPWMKRLFRQHVKPGDVVLDIGANIGLHSVALADAVGTTGKVIAFEPYPPTAKILKANVARNKHKGPVEVCEYALSSVCDDEVVLHCPGVSTRCSLEKSMGAMSIQEVADDHTVTIMTKTLDSLNLPKFTFIKIDVEQHELDVIKGSLKTLATHHPTIVYENHPWMYDSVGAVLMELGYKLSRESLRDVIAIWSGA